MITFPIVFTGLCICNVHLILGTCNPWRCWWSRFLQACYSATDVGNMRVVCAQVWGTWQSCVPSMLQCYRCGEHGSPVCLWAWFRVNQYPTELWLRSLPNDICTGSRKSLQWRSHTEAPMQNRPLESFLLGWIQDWCNWDALVGTGAPLWEGMGWTNCRVQCGGSESYRLAWLPRGSSSWTCP